MLLDCPSDTSRIAMGTARNDEATCYQADGPGPTNRLLAHPGRLRTRAKVAVNLACLQQIESKALHCMVEKIRF
jgi:hypothetical protein